MTLEDALQLVLSKLDDCGIRYMITGSFASNIHGVPRATQDADIVIEADAKALDRFLNSLGEDFYASREAAREALARRGIFNIIHLQTGLKVDLIIRKMRSFSRTEFLRREEVDFLGRGRWFASAEDIILAKLEWAKSGQSERQFADALNVAKIRGSNLDRSYLLTWARELEVEDLLDGILKELGD
jgi:hypothetical protein